MRPSATWLLALLPLGLGGCQAIGNWADNAGEHLPVIDDRCEHWQCLTQSGQARSDEIKEEKEKTPSAVQAAPAIDTYPDVPSQHIIGTTP